ncbi:MAG: hypothetical protein ACREBU_02325 [Nitrososphaera sp.]
MNQITEAIVTVFTAIIGVAILSVLVSPRSNTTGVIQATASGFVNSLATAMTPVTGERVRIRSDYPPPVGGMGFGFGLPSANFGMPFMY